MGKKHLRWRRKKGGKRTVIELKKHGKIVSLPVLFTLIIPFLTKRYFVYTWNQGRILRLSLDHLEDFQNILIKAVVNFLVAGPHFNYFFTDSFGGLPVLQDTDNEVGNCLHIIFFHAKAGDFNRPDP